MNYTTPEAVGINSADIENYLKLLDDHNLSTHNVIISRGDNICFEKYYEPFYKDFPHRLYSVSKSFVSIAVGFAMQDGLLNLDDKIEKYFPKEIANQESAEMRNQTIREMLMMSTAKTEKYWFSEKPADRVAFYFQNDGISRPSGTLFEYDSAGSFVLGALVERLTQKSLTDYLREKLFDKIGVSNEIKCLKCPGGHSWGDSAIIAKPTDMLLVMRFLLNGGKWNNEQLLDAEYVKKATTKQIDTDFECEEGFENYGYGYYIWMGPGKSFYFNGMGAQLALAIPEKDIILVYNGDNQGKPQAKRVILEGFMRYVADKAVDILPENNYALKQLNDYASSLVLAHERGDKDNPWKEKINGKTFNFKPNNAGIKTIRIDFGNTNTITWENARGEMKLNFGMCENVFGIFPEEGYSREIGAVESPGNKFKCAASASFISPFQLRIRVQIIDEYFGTLNMVFGFKEEDGKIICGANLNKTAEDFMNDYKGYLYGIC